MPATTTSEHDPLLIRVIALLGKTSQATVSIASLLLLGGVSVLQNLTGLRAAFAPFYLVPIALVALRSDRTAGLLVSTVCGTLWISVHMGITDYRFLWIDAWNNIIRVGIFISFSLILSRLKVDAEREMRLHRELQSTLTRVKQLTGLLPICAWCKRIRGEDGTWEHAEAYVAVRSEAEFTHGICPDCAQKEAELLKV